MRSPGANGTNHWIGTDQVAVRIRSAVPASSVPHRAKSASARSIARGGTKACSTSVGRLSRNCPRATQDLSRV